MPNMTVNFNQGFICSPTPFPTFLTHATNAQALDSPDNMVEDAVRYSDMACHALNGLSTNTATWNSLLTVAVSMTRQ